MSTIDATGGASGVSSATYATRARRGHHVSGGGGPDEGSRPGPGARLDQALESQGITGTALTDLRSKIDDAVKQAKANGDGSTDGREAVKSAIDQVLKENGVDVDKFQAAMRPSHGGGPGGPFPSNGSDGDGNDDGAGALTKTLQSKGVDPQQFYQALSKAIAESDGNGVDLTSVFSQFQLGSSVDTVA
ncbi:MAG TPA: hypothetical protein VH482_14765 [Thermomicrobiales bacterium]|jgi:hypothetical protein